MTPELERLMVPGPAGEIQAMLESAAPDPPVVAIICHPHPQYQGTMLNKVVHMLSRSVTDLGYTAIRFNYRGVGQSTGSYDEGRGETDDAEAVLNYMKKRFAGARIALCGFSFGSGVALRLADRTRIDALITVAPPVGRLGVPENPDINAPWQLIQGSSDELVNAKDVEKWAQAQVPPPELVMMNDVSHFFHGHLTELRQIASDFLKRAFLKSGV